MMTFQTTLPTGAHLRIENQGDQTTLSFQSGSENQRQSQSSNFSTGQWTHPPTLFQMAQGLILRLEGESSHYLSIENSSARARSDAPDLRGAQVLPLDQVADESNEMAPMKPLEPMKPMAPMQPMKPLEPMAPMKPLEPMKPMEMRLGSMQMSMGGSSDKASAPRESASSSESRAAFCTNCGQQAQEGDRFCAKCGHELRVL